jgi:membrane protease YdiL (CAAX protease family)
MAPWLSAVTLGVLWALWHLPAYFVTGLLGPFSIGYFAFFIVYCVVTRITWTWIFNKTGSVLIIALLHAASSGTTIALANRLPMIPPTAILLFLGLLIVFPVLLLLATGGRLSYQPDRVAQPAEASLTQG